MLDVTVIVGSSYVTSLSYLTMPSQDSTQRSTSSSSGLQPKAQANGNTSPDDTQAEDVLDQFEDAPEQSDEEFQDAQDEIADNSNSNSNSEDEYEDATDITNQDNGELGDGTPEARPSAVYQAHKEEQQEESSLSVRLEDTQEQEESMAVFRTSSKERVYHMGETQEFSILIDEDGNIQRTPPPQDTQSSILNLTDDEEEHQRSINGTDSSNSSSNNSSNIDNDSGTGSPRIPQTKKRRTNSGRAVQTYSEEQEEEHNDEEADEEQHSDDGEYVREDGSHDEDEETPEEETPEPAKKQRPQPQAQQRPRKRTLPSMFRAPEPRSQPERRSQPEPKTAKKRNPTKFWTNDEIAALEEGLSIIKGPSWEAIKTRMSPRLDDRNGVQIKDKARNEIKYRKLNNEPLGPFAYVDKGSYQPDSPPRRRAMRR